MKRSQVSAGWFATGLVTLAACGGAPDDSRSDEWPLSEIDLPDSSVVAERATAEMATAENAAGSAGREGSGGVSGLEDAEDGAAGDVAIAAGNVGVTEGAQPVRPEMDMDASGPLIYTQPQPRADFEDARFPRPEHVRGLYMNAWASGSSKRMTEILEIVRETEVNSLVIDIKDVTGYISHDTSVPLALEIGADGERRIRDLPALLDRLEAEGVYPIARITVVKDPILAAGRPGYAVQDTAGGVWIDSKDIIWLNPFSRGVWEYHVDIAREVAEMGFPEIQWDYIRFPDAPESDMARAVFEGSDGELRVDAIRGFLTYAREELADLPVRSTADVFGVTTSFSRDIGIGQLWETFIDVVDVALPMVYPSHYWEDSFGYRDPNAYPYEVVRAALRDALRRSARVEGAGMTRPWIQDFTLGTPIYGAPEVRAQIQAAYDVGIQEWILWNPSTRYSISALEPVSGFTNDPLVRVAGVLTPVSRRHQVMDSVAALPIEPLQEYQDSVLSDAMAPLGSIVADTTTAPDGIEVDTMLALDSVIPDTLGPMDSLVVDTLRASR
jgi:hypothetical protein